MKREQKYPDTKTFHFYNANSHNHFGGDCVVRALCTAMGQTWEETLKGLFEVGLKYGFVPTDDNCIAKYLKANGWVKMPQPRKFDNGRKFTGEEFCNIWQDREKYCAEYSSVIPANSNIIANIGGHHIVAIMNGKVNDIWNSTDGCIGKYWVKG